jgi:hypothetical protein
MPTDPNPAWRILDDTTKSNLDSAFCMQEFRKIFPGELVSMGGVKYVVDHDFEFSLAGMQIEIRTMLNGQQKLFYSDREVRLANQKIVISAS